MVTTLKNIFLEMLYGSARREREQQKLRRREVEALERQAEALGSIAFTLAEALQVYIQRR